MIDRIVWWCLLDPLFLSITSYTRTSTLYCRHSVEQQVLSSLGCPLRRTFFLSFFFYLSQHIHRVSALLSQLCALCLSLVLALILYTLGSMAAPHHHSMLTRITNAHAQDACSEMNMLQKKILFFILFFFLLTFPVLFIWFQLSFRCPTVVRQPYNA
jgi:hypothetical protein